MLDQVFSTKIFETYLIIYTQIAYSVLAKNAINHFEI